ncbi:hypothetical protein GCM10023189_32910 [Nibrella saemangeumensis]|uniref:Uncharacterized protein n=1 Tax=Nibrella saemangeumensis TaxID=1084526 RepID=A0ABP8N4A0_9BACT
MTSAIPTPPYEKSVFINCPFDDTYKPLFQAIVFTVQVCGFFPRCALETTDASHVRLQKIMTIIEECKYGIHDVSLSDGRLNMPLELGMFIGCREYGRSKQRHKQYMVFEGKAYSSKSYLSDLGGQDPMSHDNDYSKVIEGVRDWLTDKVPDPRLIPHAEHIIKQYEAFRVALLCRPMIVSQAYR